jgi:hypothetical protein
MLVHGCLIWGCLFVEVCFEGNAKTRKLYFCWEVGVGGMKGVKLTTYANFGCGTNSLPQSHHASVLFENDMKLI